MPQAVATTLPETPARGLNGGHRRFIIIGAGPTGLGAALRLQELAEPSFLLLEASAAAGGLAASVVDPQGFTWDLGGHVQFSHYARFDRYMELALGADGWLSHERQSWVWISGGFVPYPFQYNLHRLPPPLRWSCVEGLLAARRGPKRQPRHFGDWIIQTFGQGIADCFLLPYNVKVWAYPPAELDPGWVGERVAVPELDQVIRGICLGEDQVGWGPNRRFRFPRHGGTGAIWRALADRIPAANRRLRARVTAIDAAARTLTIAGGERLRWDHLISTMPLDRLAATMADRPLQALVSGLRWSSVHVIGIGLRGQPPGPLAGKCWIYFPEDDCPFYRVTLFSHYSPHNTPRPGRTWSLMAEVSESPYRPVDAQRVVDEVIAGLLATGLLQDRDAIISRWHRRLEHGYPTPTLGRDAILDRALPMLDARQVYSRGRFGAWRYEVSNQDHAFMQGVEVVERILHDREELTLHRPDLVNGRHNPFPYAEWQQRPGPSPDHGAGTGGAG